MDGDKGEKEERRMGKEGWPVKGDREGGGGAGRFEF